MSSTPDLMRRAERLTGLSDWGDTEFVSRMDAWLVAAARDRNLSTLGRQSIQAFAVRYASNRLHLEALIAAHPEIVGIEIPRPIVVTGLPRSGTTALATLLAEGPNTRSLPQWEAIEPFSSLGSETGRRLRARRQWQQVLAVMPDMAKLHPALPDSFTDDQELQGLAFGSFMLEWQAHVPDWRDRYLAEDQVPVYRYLKRAMQALTFLRGPARWVIKSPQHMEQLPALAAAFPDALLVVARRPREQVNRSMARMMAYVESHTRHGPMPARYWQDRFDLMAERYQASGQFPDRIEVKLTEWSTSQARFRSMIHARAGLIDKDCSRIVPSLLSPADVDQAHQFGRGPGAVRRQRQDRMRGLRSG